MSDRDVFIGGLFGADILGLMDDDPFILKALESEASKYFPNCPICGSGKIQVHLVMGGKDTISCENCGARWHIYFGHVLGHLKWAELELEADDGRGEELLGQKVEANKWREMAIESRKKLRAQNMKEKRTSKK